MKFTSQLDKLGSGKLFVDGKLIGTVADFKVSLCEVKDYGVIGFDYAAADFAHAKASTVSMAPLDPPPNPEDGYFPDKKRAEHPEAFPEVEPPEVEVNNLDQTVSAAMQQAIKANVGMLQEIMNQGLVVGKGKSLVASALMDKYFVESKWKLLSQEIDKISKKGAGLPPKKLKPPKKLFK